jgi:nucleotide-binding universal stress UspA family protein
MAEKAQPAGRRIAVSLPGALDREDVKSLTAWCLAHFIEPNDSIFLIHASTSPSPAWVTGGEARAVEYKHPQRFPSWVPEALIQATVSNKEVKAFELDATSFTPVDAILDFVQALGVDVLLIGSRARSGVAKTVLFSSSSYLAEYADTVPVLVVRGTPPAPATGLGDPAVPRQIALALDGTDACRRLAAFATRTVLRPCDKIYLMHSPYDLEASQLLTALTILDNVRSDLLGRGFTNVFPMELDADIDTRDALVDQLQAGEPPFTLCILGSRGLRGSLKRLWMGSVSSYVTSHSPCPVLIVPPGVLPVEQQVEQEAPPPA